MYHKPKWQSMQIGLATLAMQCPEGSASRSLLLLADDCDRRGDVPGRDQAIRNAQDAGTRLPTSVAEKL